MGDSDDGRWGPRLEKIQIEKIPFFFRTSPCGYLAVEKNRALYVKLYPEVSNLTRECPPTASFVIRVLCTDGDCKTLVHPEIDTAKQE
ncbi:BTB/POZ domain-containing protein [Drosera capensis]